jgi:hypothetical protein
MKCPYVIPMCGLGSGYQVVRLRACDLRPDPRYAPPVVRKSHKDGSPIPAAGGSTPGPLDRSPSPGGRKPETGHPAREEV